MKVIVFIGFAAAAVVTAAITRSKRQAYELPDGSELIFPGTIKTSFQCAQHDYGYYADVDNNCYIFHVCHPIQHSDGSVETRQYSFICGNQTVFNQLTLSCTFPGDEVPCSSAPQFYALNARFGREKEPFLTEQDIVQANQLRTGGGAPGRG